MASCTGKMGRGSAVKQVRALGWGSNDPRLRASWRVLLALPVLWVLTGGVLTGDLQSAISVIPSSGGPDGGLAQSLLHAGFFRLALLGWARYLDRRPLSTYGVSISRGWMRDGLIGFGAVLVGAAIWTGLTAGLGGTTLVIAPTLPQGSVLLGVVVSFIALGLHAAVQQVVFFRVILKTAAEGLHSRGVGASHAVVATVPVAVLLFILLHGSMTPLRVLDLVVAGSFFGLLYLHTGELALGIGAHFGALYSGIVVSAIVQESGSLSGVFAVLDQYGFPTMRLAYVVVVAWLRWWWDEFTIQRDIARWSRT